MITKNRFLLLITGLLFFTACGRRQANTEVRTLQKLVDKPAWAVCDTMMALFRSPRNIDPDSIITVLKTELKKYPYQTDSATHAWLTVNIGQAYGYKGELDSLGDYCFHALPYFESHPDFLLPLNMCYTGIGFNMLVKQENIYKANYYSTKAAALCLLPTTDTSLTYDLKVQSLNDGSQSNRTCKLYTQALHFARESFKIAYPHRYNIKNAYSRALAELADNYTSLKKFDSSLLWLHAADRWNDTIKSAYAQRNNYDAWSNYYYTIGRYDSCLAYWKTMTPRPNVNSRFGIAANFLELYSRLHQQSNAAENLKICSGLADSVAEDNAMLSFSSAKTLYLILYGDRADAEKSFLDFQKKNEAFYDNERMKIFATIEPEYNLAEKQKRIDKLNYVNKAAADEIRQKNNLLVITVLAILLSVVVIMVLLLLSRQRKLQATNQLIITQRDKAELEQKLLRTQMDPHFIFNCIVAIKQYNKQGDAAKANEFVDAFSSLIRLTFEMGTETFVSLEKELAYLTQFIFIEKARFNDQFDFSLTKKLTAPETAVPVPAMLLQPIIENAVRHGVYHLTDRRGMISVDITQKENNIVIVITDNGVGREQSRSFRQSLYSGALNSTVVNMKRIDILNQLFNNQISLKTEDVLDAGGAVAGTRVTISYPVSIQQLNP
ncbi:sensor histidine kinase [Chitinophagaceae bacterium MMS25-I14]